MRRVELSERAEQQLDEIAFYSAAEWGRDVAARYLDGLFRTMQLLARRPSLGRKVGVRRRYRYERHLVYYRVSAEALEVLRIVLERRSPRNHR